MLVNAFLCVFSSTDTHRPYSNTLNDVRETPLSSSSPSSSPNATNNRKFVLDDDLLVEDPNGLNNVEYIKLKKVLVQPVHDVDVVQYEPEVSSELGTGKKYFIMINIVLSYVLTLITIIFCGHLSPNVFVCVLSNVFLSRQLETTPTT